METLVKTQQRKLIAVVSLCVAIIVPTLASAASISGQGTWETTLQARSFDGGATIGGYYDTSLNITWLANANYTNTPSVDWTTANFWAGILNINGITGWRLPTTVDVGNDGCSYTNYYQGVDCGYNITTPSEMSHLFYTTLGDKAYFNTSGVAQAGYGLTNTGPFSNVQSGYWSATEFVPDTSTAWYFNTYVGEQSSINKTFGLSAWFVHSGDVGASAVPVPAAVWLFSSGLLGLVGVSGKRRR